MINQTMRNKIKTIPLIGASLESLFKSINALKSGPRVLLINPRKDLAAFWPYSAGSNPARSRQALSTAGNFLLSFRSVVEAFFEVPKVIVPDELQVATRTNALRIKNLSEIFEKYGSDKGDNYYHEFYGLLFQDVGAVTRVVEIGIGTNSPNVLSNMGKLHTGVGGSLRSWREFFPKAQIHGFDIDENCLFTENRISTSQLNQLDQNEVKIAMSQFPDESIDLFVDDGLHAVDANLTPIPFVLPKLKKGGWLVVEDIGEQAIPAWEVLSALPNEELALSRVIRTKKGYIFVMQKSHWDAKTDVVEPLDDKV